MLVIERLHAFSDNYIWLITDGADAVVVDPGDAAPVIAYCQAHSLNLKMILLTHWHGDHQGGVLALTQFAPEVAVFGSKKVLSGPSHPVAEGDRLDCLGAEFRVLEVPGHTLDHVAYVSDSPVFEAPVAFTGDTLFAAGCGRLFEGSASQMYDSLAKFNHLPANTRLYCAHEYTLGNLEFARFCEPQVTAIADRLEQVRAQRSRGEATVPTVLWIERETNPFLRAADVSVLATRRTQKDQFS